MISKILEHFPKAYINKQFQKHNIGTCLTWTTGQVSTHAVALIQERFVEIAIVEVATYPGEDTSL